MKTLYFPAYTYTLHPFERGIGEALSKCGGFVMPNVRSQVPFFELVRVCDVCEHTMDVHPQPVITKDNVELYVEGILWVRPAIDEKSVKQTFYNIEDWKKAIMQRAMTGLRLAFNDLTLDESLVDREKVGANLQQVLSTYAAEWGLAVSRVEISLAYSPEAIKTMQKQMTSEQERRARRLLAIEEFMIAEQQKLAMIQRTQSERTAAIQMARSMAKAIGLDNEAATTYFPGHARALKQMGMTKSVNKSRSDASQRDRRP